MRWTDEQKIAYLDRYVEDFDELLKKGEKEKERFLRYVEEGVQKGWENALYIKGYGCYGGNELFACDWKAARECMERLIAINGDPGCYNSLGYICYYARTTPEPEYEKAFQYFTVGHACGIFESTYKLADMLQQGLGCPKSEQAAFHLITRIFDENHERFCNGEYDGKFADVALRMGQMFEHGIEGESNVAMAYAFYMQAKLAIDMRIKEGDYFGDNKVKKRIEEALQRIQTKLPEDFDVSYMKMQHPGPIGDILENSLGMDVTITYVNGKYMLLAHGVGAEGYSGQALITVAQMHFCELTDVTGVYLVNPTFVHGCAQIPARAFVTGIRYDEEEDVWELTYRDQVMISFRVDAFIFGEE
ncbi:sel1 repeat family protein [Eubacterium oxidoreducens]|uniref:Sel1 repeat family protein n=1 Tax=Eubacterium oxidoreducens TaxID=1732 RepID=A0A1G6AFH9_EUBOX|nr:sel1 repeat family protein [Eubacterium oxidoreducens]SDB07135.1 hypothetical protein SAMN02910417_00520 [Eubacterium oxidoreducens]